MTAAPDLPKLWHKAKHATLSEQEVAACERVLENPQAEDVHLAILIVGVSRRPTDRLVKIVDAYLRDGKSDEERYSAMRTLCSYWGLWQHYLPYLYSKMEEGEWEDDYALADEATQLTGRYLAQNGDDAGGWRKLLEVYDAAVARNDAAAAGLAENAMMVALSGSSEALRTQINREPLADDAIVREARVRAGTA
jgi:hypothetical protein